MHQDVGVRGQATQAGTIDRVAAERDHALRAFEAITETDPALAEGVGKIEAVAVVHDLGGDAPAVAFAHQAGEDVGGLRGRPGHIARFVDAELDVLVVDLVDQCLDDAPGFRRPVQAERLACGPSARTTG